MLFTSIKENFAGMESLNLLISASGEEMTVVVLPKAKEGANAGLMTPLQLKGTAEELDREFPALFGRYTVARKSLEEQIAETETVLAAAKKEEQEKATKKTAASAKPKATTGTEVKAGGASAVSAEKPASSSVKPEPTKKDSDFELF